jgi:hypothetical protein
MPTKRGPDGCQIEDHVKRISRRLIERQKKRNARGGRDHHDAAHKLIQRQQQQDRMGVQHEFERLDRYQVSAAQLQAEAARLLRRRRTTTKTSVTPNGKTRTNCAPSPKVSAGRLHLATVHPAARAPEDVGRCIWAGAFRLP